MVLVDVFSVSAGSFFVSDGSQTIIIYTALPISGVFPCQPTSVTGNSFVDYDLVITDECIIRFNDVYNLDKFNHTIFYYDVDNAAGGYKFFTGYPSGSQFNSTYVTRSFVSQDCVVSVSQQAQNGNIVRLIYDCYCVPRSVGSMNQFTVSAGFSLSGSLSFASTSRSITLSLTANPPISGAKSLGTTIFPLQDANTSVLSNIAGAIASINSKISITNQDLQELISLTNTANTLLTALNTAINNGFTSVNNNLVDINGHIVQFDKDMVTAITNQTTEIQTSITNLQTAVLKSLETINNQLILIKNGLVRLDYDLLNSFNFFLSALTGVQDNWSQLEFTVTNANRIIKNLQDNWSAIIEKGLDKVAPDTSKFDTEQEAASKQLADIGQSDLISGIGDTSDADVAFHYFTSVFQGFHSKILLYNNLLQQVFNSLGNLRYVIYATMGVGLLGFFFRVGNTFIRSGSGGSSKSVNFPKKLK